MDVIRTAMCRTGVIGMAFAAVACSQTQAPPRTAQTQLTSADLTQVSVQRAPGAVEGVPPPRVVTPLQQQMEDDLRYPTPAVEHIAQWRARYPSPARMMAEWMSDHPDTAQRLVRLEYEQPDHVRVLVKWAAAHPYENLGEFMLAREGWQDVRAMRDADPAALDDFLAWCRAAPRAAEELVMHSEGFRPFLVDEYRVRQVSSAKRPNP